MLQSNNIPGHAGVFIVNFKCIRLMDIWFYSLYSVVDRKKFCIASFQDESMTMT